jgi:hypothetical protein
LAQWLDCQTQIGVEGNFLDLYKSHLTNRKQCAVVDGIKSSMLDIKAGGPLIFFIFRNNIDKDIFADIKTNLQMWLKQQPYYKEIWK